MILTFLGARPQFVKAAVVSKSLKNEGLEEIIVHSGQHYDERMSKIFWDELQLPLPLYNLKIGSESHTVQTARMMMAFEEIVIAHKKSIKAVLLLGDTNTTLAGSLVASKMNVPVIHIEAGLRSFNRTMPEEINRIVTDHLSQLLFCTSELAVEQLLSEGIKENVYDVGDVMYDAFLKFSSLAAKNADISNLVDDKPHLTLLTLHRPVNTDNLLVLQTILNQLGQLPTQLVWPVHPRNRSSFANLYIPENIKVVEPLSYFEMLLLLEKCNRVITDSGGLQKEAYWAKKPCITLRDETEWSETLQGGWNLLSSVNDNKLLFDFNKVPYTNWAPLYGDGKASEKIAQIIKRKFS